MKTKNITEWVNLYFNGKVVKPSNKPLTEYLYIKHDKDGNPIYDKLNGFKLSDELKKL